mmetsp:Transcript_22439/g.71772  ORF Transcript_22439/g.71772 Transcript_22439/m.71772 type:complete len:308 (+) Transcript_22439:24-947(+)
MSDSNSGDEEGLQFAPDPDAPAAVATVVSVSASSAGCSGTVVSASASSSHSKPAEPQPPEKVESWAVSEEEEERELSERWCTTRETQTDMHLAKLQGGLARRYLNWDERCAARADLERAMQEIRRDRVAAAQCETASAVFWAICLAQNQAAKRPSGWVVDSAAAAAAWHMDTMHAQLIHYKGERQATGEKAGNATRVGSSGRGRGRGSVSGYSAAAAMGDASKMRSLRLDSLGDRAARQRKLQCLDKLLRADGGAGLEAPILAMRPPTVQVFEAAGTARAAATSAVGRFFGGKRAREDEEALGEEDD